MTIQEAIKKAIEGGWKESSSWFDGVIIKQKAFLDPIFWQALGKSLGWEDFMGGYEDRCFGWVYQWHSFIDHLAKGESAESFFEELK